MAELTVPITILEGSDQAKDIAASKGPTDIWKSCYRVKQYVKDEDLYLGAHPGNLEFPQPYQAGAAKTTYDWNATNRVFLGQMAGCNLDCPYCFVGCNAKSQDVTPYEYLDAYDDYNEAFSRNVAGVLRVSGGEPLMSENKQKWVSGLIQAAQGAGHYIWIDTNLTCEASNELLEELDQSLDLPSVGVCGCFKPGIKGVNLTDQIAVAKQFVEANTDIYFYYPSWGDTPAKFYDFLCQLKDEIPYAPLKLTVIRIKWHYAAVKAAALGYDVEHEDYISGNNFRDMRRIWREFCDNAYPKKLCWLPSNQINLTETPLAQD